MKKFINAIEDIRLESLRGFAAAHAGILILNDSPVFIHRRERAQPAKVALVSGGGSGHEPLHGGFVGHGMLDAACPGFIFTAPSADQILAACAAVASDKGTLFVVKNFPGDIMHFEMAAGKMQTPFRTVVVADDVSGIAADPLASRRGVAGTIVVQKVAGAAAQAGLPLEECARIADQVNQRTRSIGVALTSGTVPSVGRPTFDVGDTELEFGVGIHGERGSARRPFAPADTIMNEMIDVVMANLEVRRGEPLLVLINGFGGTPLLELYLMFDAARRLLSDRGFRIERSLVGNYVGSLDMAGCSLTVTALDTESTALWDAPVHTPALRW